MKKTQYQNNIILKSTPEHELTLIEASLRKNEDYVYKTLIDDRKKIKTKFKMGDSVRYADRKIIFRVMLQIVVMCCNQLQNEILIKYQVIGFA